MWYTASEYENAVNQQNLLWLNRVSLILVFIQFDNYVQKAYTFTDLKGSFTCL